MEHVMGWQCVNCGQDAVAARGIGIGTDCPGPAEPAQVAEQLHSAREWERIDNDGLAIMDPDGWRKNDGVTLDTPITREDYLRRRAISTLCPVKQPPSEPDVDEVRQALELGWAKTTEEQDAKIWAAARAYLRLREQQPQQHPTIAQVVEACGGSQLQVLRSAESPVRRLARAYGDFAQPTSLAFGADTPEAAIRALYDDAVAKLEQQRDEAAAKLQKLGRS